MMKTIVMLGAGQMGKAAAALVNEAHYQVLAFGDNNAVGNIYGIPILPVVDTIRLQPDIMVLTVRGQERETALEQQVRTAGYTGHILTLVTLLEAIDIRKATLLRLVKRTAGLAGAVAELGVYKGGFAAVLNGLFPDRKLYLFDTFSGFDGKDITTERECRYSMASVMDFSDTSVAAVLARLPHPEQVIVKQGYFPGTTEGIKEKFALVSLDADLYAPTLAGLEWFLPRMAAGGVLILHDWDSARFQGVKKAVETYEKQHGRIALVPLGDLHGTAVIVAGNQQTEAT